MENTKIQLDGFTAYVSRSYDGAGWYWWSAEVESEDSNPHTATLFRSCAEATANFRRTVKRLKQRGELHLLTCLALVASGLVLQCLIFAVDFLTR